MQILPQTIKPTSNSPIATDPFESSGGSTGATADERRPRRHFHWNGATTVGMVIVIGNLVTCATLQWFHVKMFGNIDPVVWVAISLLMPSALICLSVYREYWPAGWNAAPIERLGPYVLKSKLGSGGMGEVFLAEHQLMKRQCAVKLIHPRQARDRRMRASFEREAQATAQLTHWNTVEMYDYGTTDDGRFYYVMEYLKGMNLSQYVQRYGPMEPGRVVYILKQMCNALYEADCAGLVHRDIKPSNIFLTERGKSYDVVKLLDFGLVQATTPEPIGLRNVDTKLHGSPAFMCPEQAVGMTPDSRGDLYSLGAVAYFLLTGHPPFVDENPIMLIVAHATTAVPTFEEIGVHVPRDLSDTVLKCLSREASSRFASGRELLQALEQCSANTEWAWSSAEQWWRENDPTAEVPDLQPEPAYTNTLRMDRGTEPDLPACVPIDFEEPTAIYEVPSELSEV
ncbi:MAG: serine/threonine-protein kinase [Fuerstiella sp.]